MEDVADFALAVVGHQVVEIAVVVGEVLGHFGLVGSGCLIMAGELVLVLLKELHRLLGDGAERQEADDAHAGGYQEVLELALIPVIGRQGNLPKR